MSPQFVMSPNDLQNALGALRSMGDPVGLVYRMAGLGQSEREAGIPGWAWLVVAAGAGIALGAVYGPVVREKLGFALKRA